MAAILPHPSSAAVTREQLQLCGELGQLAHQVHLSDVRRGLVDETLYWTNETHRRNCLGRAAVVLKLATPERLDAIVAQLARELRLDHATTVASLPEAERITTWFAASLLTRLMDASTLKGVAR